MTTLCNHGKHSYKKMCVNRMREVNKDDDVVWDKRVKNMIKSTMTDDQIAAGAEQREFLEVKTRHAHEVI